MRQMNNRWVWGIALSILFFVMSMAMGRRSYADACKVVPSKEQALFSQKEVTIRGKHFVHEVIRGDGNCLFRSIAHLIYGNQNVHEKVRCELVDFAQMNWEKYKEILEKYYPECVASRDYRELMGKLGVWV